LLKFLLILVLEHSLAPQGVTTCLKAITGKEMSKR
jgi:hypothetical protein